MTLGFVGFFVLALQFLKSFETRLRFGLATFAFCDPIKFTFDCLLTCFLTSVLARGAFPWLQAKLNSSFKRDAAATVKL